LSNQSRQVKGFQAEVSGLGSTITRSFGKAFIAVGGTTAVVSGLKASVGAASDLNEEVSKSQQVFGDASRGLEEWSKTTARSLGIARTEALRAAGTFGNLLNVVGVAPERSAEMSRALVQLAADLASFNNASPTEAPRRASLQPHRGGRAPAAVRRPSLGGARTAAGHGSHGEDGRGVPDRSGEGARSLRDHPAGHDHGSGRCSANVRDPRQPVAPTRGAVL
jgi:hypothetical protein